MRFKDKMINAWVKQVEVDSNINTILKQQDEQIKKIEEQLNNLSDLMILNGLILLGETKPKSKSKSKKKKK